MTTPANAHVLDWLGEAHAIAAWLAGRSRKPPWRFCGARPRRGSKPSGR